jgi:hypothetical protein
MKLEYHCNFIFRCWHSDPSKRPNIYDISYEVLRWRLPTSDHNDKQQLPITAIKPKIMRPVPPPPHDPSFKPFRPLPIQKELESEEKKKPIVSPESPDTPMSVDGLPLPG